MAAAAYTGTLPRRHMAMCAARERAAMPAELPLRAWMFAGHSIPVVCIHRPGLLPSLAHMAAVSAVGPATLG
jgi:hypothetical protein